MAVAFIELSPDVSHPESGHQKGGFVCVLSGLSPEIQTEVTGCQIGINLRAHRRFLNGTSVCVAPGFSFPVQSRKLKTGRTHSFWPLWLTELLPCGHFWNGPQGPMQQSPACVQGASGHQKCPLGYLLMCVDGAHFHLASHCFHWKCRGFLFCLKWNITEWILTAGVFLKAVWPLNLFTFQVFFSF